jgi:predicted MFS family arabinose efflux permease
VKVSSIRTSVVSAQSSRWTALVAFAAVGATTQLLWLTFAPITSDAAKHYGVSETAIGWLANVFPLAYVVLAIPTGIWLDRWFRPALALGAALMAAGALVRIAADSYVMVLAGQSLVAAAQPLVLNAITGFAHRYLAPADRAKGIAAASAATFAGMIAAFALSTAVSLRHALAVDAVVAVVTALWLVFSLRIPPAEEAATPPAVSVRTTWGDPLVRRLCLLVFVPFGTFTALTTWAETLLKPAGVSSHQAGALLLVNIVCGVAGSAVLPVWAARRGAEIRVMATAVGLTAAACLVLALVPGFTLALIVFAVFGFFLLATLPMVLEIVERRTAEPGIAAGLVWLSGQLGALVLTGFIGVIVHHAASSFLVLAIATAAAAAAVVRLRSVLGGAGD